MATVEDETEPPPQNLEETVGRHQHDQPPVALLVVGPPTTRAEADDQGEEPACDIGIREPFLEEAARSNKPCIGDRVLTNLEDVDRHLDARVGVFPTGIGLPRAFATTWHSNECTKLSGRP